MHIYMHVYTHIHTYTLIYPHTYIHFSNILIYTKYYFTYIYKITTKQSADDKVSQQNYCHKLLIILQTKVFNTQLRFKLDVLVLHLDYQSRTVC